MNVKKFVWVSTGIICFVLFTLTGYVFYSNNLGNLKEKFSFTKEVNANPDYICKKTVSTNSCQITNWGPRKDGYRIGYGYIPKKVAYINRRTDCNAGYTQEQVGGSGGDGGRRSPWEYIDCSDKYGGDCVIERESCTVKEIDNVNPEGKGETK